MKKHAEKDESKKKEESKTTINEEMETAAMADNQSVNEDTVETAEQKNDLTGELQLLKEKCAELNDKNLRLMAEFDNYRKRTLKERVDLIKTASEGVLSDMLPLIDDFERARKAMETADDIQAVREGIDLIYNKFISFLNQKGVKEIPTESEVFDTEFHEAITTFPAPSDDLKGKIIDCVSKGYTLNDKVIRFSKVVVGE